MSATANAAVLARAEALKGKPRQDEPDGVNLILGLALNRIALLSLPLFLSLGANGIPTLPQ